MVTDVRKVISDIADSAYSAAIAELTKRGKTANVDELHSEVVGALLGAVNSGSLDVDETLKHLLHEAARAADRRATEGGKRIMDMVLDGQLELGNMNDDVVIVLGKGERTRWGNVDADAILRMDNLRFENVENATREYRRFRDKITQPMLQFFRDHRGTVTDLHAEGIL